MLKTYKAIIHNDRLKWLEESPQNIDSKQDLYVHVTILDRQLQKDKYENTLVDFFRESPLYDSGIDLTRGKDYGREVML
jgi:hypothetical protein